jgi:hypothetical protein
MASAQTRMFAPYIDMSLSDNNLAQISQASGIKDFTMAFIVSDNGQAEWGGVGLVSTETTMVPLINALRAQGGNVIISFGGASGTELADASGMSLSSLEAQYQAVINKYGATALDFDIEGGAGSNTTGINLRNEALAALQAANPGLVVSYTLPVLPTGLVQDGLNVLSNAKSNGVNVSVVNVMAMDYGSSFTGDMGTYAIDAANATISQLQSIGLSALVGIIPMIGQNDTSVETFTLADAQAVETYANGNSSIGRMSFWSVARDQSCADDADTVSPDCSGITQNPWDFSHIFEAFGGGGTTPTVATPTFSPAGGTYASAQSVSISDSTSGATIYYTTNGSTPTTSSTKYSGAISVGSTTTIEAIGVLSGDNNSSVASATYTINTGGGTTVATPTFSPGSGTYTSTQSVSISDSTSGATIYYTTNGSTPTTSSSVYSGAISVSSTTTIEAMAAKSGDTNSSVASATYTISTGGGGNEPAPTFSEPTGTYTKEVHTRISDTDANAAIYYTTNGSTPTSSSTPNPDSTIEFTTTTTLKSIAIDNGVSSPVTTATYTITP